MRYKPLLVGLSLFLFVILVIISTLTLLFLLVKEPGIKGISNKDLANVGVLFSVLFLVKSAIDFVVNRLK